MKIAKWLSWEGRFGRSRTLNRMLCVKTASWADAVDLAEPSVDACRLLCTNINTNIVIKLRTNSLGLKQSHLVSWATDIWCIHPSLHLGSIEACLSCRIVCWTAEQRHRDNVKEYRVSHILRISSRIYGNERNSKMLQIERYYTICQVNEV